MSPGCRIVHVTDPHLGHAGGARRHDAAMSAWANFRRHVAEHRPDLVVVTGDVVVDDPDHDGDRRLARSLFDELGTPVLAVPGNHDVGDHEVRAGLPADWHGAVVSSERVQRWEETWGPSHWLHEIAGWWLIGLNSPLFGSSLDAEHVQWDWLRDVALPAVRDCPVIVFMHESLHLRPEPLPRDTWMTLPTDASRRLVDELAPADVRLLATGHTHALLEWQGGGFRHVTAPSLTAPIPTRTDMVAPRGLPAAGWLEYVIDAGELTIHAMRSPES